MTLYSPRIDDALQFTADAFRTIARKGSKVPYLTHLLQVMVTVGEHGGDEDQLIAALLHDYLEDVPGADAASCARGSAIASSGWSKRSPTRPRSRSRRGRIGSARYLGRSPRARRGEAHFGRRQAPQCLQPRSRSDHPRARGLVPVQRADGSVALVLPRRDRLAPPRLSHAIVDDLEAVVRRIHDRAGVPYVPADVAALLAEDAGPR
jgi:hypothetical protein